MKRAANAHSNAMPDIDWREQQFLLVKKTCYGTRRAPVCRQHVCEPRLMVPNNGRKTCSKANYAGSQCNFTCNTGYRMEGSSHSMCQDDQTWSHSAPECRPILCFPPHVAPTNGAIRCTNENVLGSKCRFMCDKDYAVVGPKASFCKKSYYRKDDSNGEWSTLPATCQKITCTPDMVAPQYGRIDCTDGSNAGSRCTFYCNSGYSMIGSMYTACLNEIGTLTGVWQNPAPVCRPIQCDPRLENPERGQVSCLNGVELGSMCRFTCDYGNVLLGSGQTTCTDDGNGDVIGVWSAPPSRCEPIVCLPLHEAPTNGFVSCTNDAFLGSVCEFSCDDSYKLIGNPICSCTMGSDGGLVGRWSDYAPVCLRKSCPAQLLDPMNGQTICTDAIFLGSECEFTCHDNHMRVGPLYSNCIELEDGSVVWDRPVPKCEPIKCPDQFPLAHGEMTCSKSNFATSRCQFRCTADNYQLYPPTTENHCLNTSNWDVPKPCCARPCPPFAVMDFVVVHLHPFTRRKSVLGVSLQQRSRHSFPDLVARPPN
uniref:Sushi domain-containing protein n=1 Tax=Ciona savignyi TaxID=51511 RepID=H2ZPN8_CIOSA